MRPVPIVPFGIFCQVIAEIIQAERDEDVIREFRLQGQDEPLDDRDTAVLADRAVPQPDLLSLGPLSEVVTVELRTAV